MMRSLKIVFVILLLTLSTTLFAAEKAFVLEINGAITPATQDYFKRSLAKAVKEHAVAVILKLNTPGGLETSMRGINEAIITSPIPIITYVTPSGARAASAGTFIMYASHLAAMAPGTNIGAASPIYLLDDDKSKVKELNTKENKAMNDAAAYMRSLAQLRGRNADWADLSVRKAASLSAEEAKKLKVIDEVADDLSKLLQKIDGHAAMVLGNSEAVKTKNLELQEVKPDWHYELLEFITNPNIAYILMLIAIYGLFFELSNPGLILPGVVGIISLVLVLYAFQLMPLNYSGLSLLLIGIALMITEVFIASYGMLGIGGLIAFILGSIMLFDINNPNYYLNWSLILIMSLLSIAFFLMLITLAIRSHRRKVITGEEGMVGSTGIVLTVSERKLTVRVHGEIWEARSSQQLNPGETIQVEKSSGLVLYVKPIKE